MHKLHSAGLMIHFSCYRSASELHTVKKSVIEIGG